jgi:predicted enzyme related to lactoylglutathione lyase
MTWNRRRATLCSEDRSTPPDKEKSMSASTSKIVWFEIPADDMKRAQGFYGGLFGWRFEDFQGPFEYHMASEAGGAIRPTTNGLKGPVVYFGVDDIDAAMERVGDLGGMAGERQEIPDVGSCAVSTPRAIRSASGR